MLSPGMTENPDHKLSVEPLPKRVQIYMEGEKIVESKNALRMVEDGHEPVLYLPREEIRSVEFIKCGEYHCPFKGRAELYNVKHGSSTFENAAWSYVAPYDEFQELKDKVAFYTNQVQEIMVTG
jgi:uncharacterized protein (DUF427 family)